VTVTDVDEHATGYVGLARGLAANLDDLEAFTAHLAERADRNHQRALGMWSLIFPPWRLPAWWREQRAVRFEAAELRALRATVQLALEYRRTST
jgi:hypothetical protein